MKLASFEALASALANAGVRYLIAGGLAVKEAAGRPEDRIDIEHLRMKENQ